ncbi:hypothetical protein KCP76_11310 [Salmonella enterica subsp. enterica serovar Weltevreden]|nr:hypothetical protein KCP76_11310 [Salmonella enterica subsp. enterica serovar Weltevreden]
MPPPPAGVSVTVSAKGQRFSNRVKLLCWQASWRMTLTPAHRATSFIWRANAERRAAEESLSVGGEIIEMALNLEQASDIIERMGSEIADKVAGGASGIFRRRRYDNTFYHRTERAETRGKY